MRICFAIATLLSVFASPFALQAQSRESNDRLAVSVPGKSWEARADVRGFSVKGDGSKPDGSYYLLAENDSTGVTLSITLTPVEGEATIEDCWKVLRERTRQPGFKAVDIRESQAGEMAVSEFVVPEAQGYPIRQKNVFGCLAKENVYVDIHLSKVQFKAADQQLFTSILNAFHLADRNGSNASSSPPNRQDLWREGGRYFINGQFDKAIGPYQKALDLEQKERTLDAKLWRVLIDNLSMAYGIFGNLKSAEQVLQYGISNDPTYPLFYYNLACVAAERNDLDNAIKYLRTAFQYKQNIITGEKMPDPAKDDSFQRFLQNDKFRKLLDSLK